ncbi:hypothetical protein WA026_010823 [Henosepilachna vigintioctopunctata]|uniref:Uncharacterized protein n=1 Tax=Henosepilachna vigintioctopunctata TaxID=420089 RepID=A0AAW1UP37_9CUCU
MEPDVIVGANSSVSITAIAVRHKCFIADRDLTFYAHIRKRFSYVNKNLFRISKETMNVSLHASKILNSNVIKELTDGTKSNICKCFWRYWTVPYIFYARRSFF